MSMRPNTTLISRTVLAGATALVAVGGFVGCERPLTWENVNADIDREFPTVANITTAELAAELDHPPCLLDVRTKEEFDVSHLPGAVNAPTIEEARQALAAEPPGREVVVYCSVGWRSAAMAEHLRADRPDHVRNLRGSIFQWANEGRPLESADGPTRKVHPYNARWGTLLKPAR